jgi:glycosyltransferase involved in cell wall biosynthesis
MHIIMTVNAAWNVLNFRRPLLDAFLADGHRVTVLAPPDHSVPRLERLGASVVPLQMDIKGLNPWHDYRLFERLVKHFGDEKPDVVLSYTIKNNILGAFAARRCGVPFIPNVTGLGTAFLSGRRIQVVAEVLYRRAFRKLPVVFFQNQEDRDLFVGRSLIDATQAAVLPGSGLDLAWFSPAPRPADGLPTTFLMIGRLLRDKGTVEFVEAARRVRRLRPDVRFQLLGAIGAENRTAIDAAQVAAWQAEGVISHLGHVEDVRPFIARASCVVLPSYREGAPRTLIEAAAMARPLIATDVPGCRSVVEDEVNGFLCEARSAGSLADACMRMLSLSVEQRRAMGLAGREKMERGFDHARVVAAYRTAIATATRASSRENSQPVLSAADPAVRRGGGIPRNTMRQLNRGQE